jgi:hypothetical protein
VTLELGRSGSTGTRGQTPVLRNGAVVATVRASQWREAASAVIDDREWVFEKSRGTLAARWAADPEGTSRLSAMQTSFWRGTWTADLEGTVVEVRSLSRWRSTRGYLVDGREVARSGNTGGWSPRPTLVAGDTLPLHQQVFLLWLELVISRRDQAALAGATTAAVIGGTT